MAINNKIRDEKLVYVINWKAAIISGLPCRENDKYEYLTAEEILPSDQSWVIQEGNFTYSPLEKALEKKT